MNRTYGKNEMVIYVGPSGNLDGKFISQSDGYVCMRSWSGAHHRYPEGMVTSDRWLELERPTKKTCDDCGELLRKP